MPAGCIKRGRTQKLVECIKQNRIKQVIFEKSSPYCLYMPNVRPMDAVGLLEKMGMDIKYVDMEPGIVPAIKQTAALLGKEKAGAELAASYQKAVAKFKRQTEGLKLNKRVVVLNGVYQAQTGKSFVRVEAPGCILHFGCTPASGPFSNRWKGKASTRNNVYDI